MKKKNERDSHIINRNRKHKKKLKKKVGKKVGKKIKTY